MNFRGIRSATFQFAMAIMLPLPPAVASDVDFSLAAGGQISGTVTDVVSGAALANQVVHAVDSTTSELIDCDVTDENGDYGLTVDSGSYLVYATGGAAVFGSAYAGEFYPNA